MKLNGQVVINNTQFWTLLSSSTWPTIIGYCAGIMTREAGHDMWLGGIFAIFNAIILAFIFIYVGQKFPGETVVEYSKKLFGAFPAKLLGLVLAVYYLLSAYQSVTIYVHHISDFLLTETPFLVITVIYVVVICYLVWHGPETIARIGVIGFILAVFFTILIFLATLNEINFSRILPLFDAGLPAIANAGITGASFTSQYVFIIPMILPIVKVQQKAFRSAAIGLIIGGFIFLFYLIAELMVMGPHVTAQMRIACMDLVRSIQITRYLHRFESFMAALWYWSMLTQAGILTYCTALAVQQTIGVKKSDKLIVISLGVLLVSLTYLLASNRIVFLNFLEGPWEYISIPIIYGIPPLLLITAFFRKGKQK